MDLPAQKDTKKDSNNYHDFHKSNYLRVSQAAQVLGTSPSTLRRFESEGLITSERLPKNNYRVFKLSDINLLKSTLQDKKSSKKHAQEKKKIQKVQIQRTVKVPTYTPEKITPKSLEKLVKTSVRKEFKLPTIKLAPVIVAMSLVATVATILLSGPNLNDILGKISSNKGKDSVLSNIQSNVLAARARVSDFVYNINIPSFFTAPVTVEDTLTVTGLSTLSGGVNTPTLTFTGVGTMNNLLAIDDTTEDTLEAALDIDGEVTSTGLLDTVIADGVIDAANLTSDIEYDGDWDFTGTWSIDGTAIEAVAAEINILSGLTTTTDELNYLDGTTVTAGGVMFGDGTKITQDIDNLFWDDTLNRLGIGTSSPTAYLDIIGATSAAASLRLRSGSAPVGPNTGDIYADGSSMYYYDGSTWQDLTSGGVGSITSVGSVTLGAAFSDSSASGDWFGLGSTAGRLEFYDSSTDIISFLGANIGLGTTAPDSLLHLSPTTAAAIQLDPYGTEEDETSELRFLELASNGTNYTGFRGPESLVDDLMYTLPASTGVPDYVLTWQDGNILEWKEVAGVGGAGDITQVGSIISGIAFADATADDDWLGLGGAAGRIEFDDQTPDQINFLDAYVGINTQTPNYHLEVNGTALIGDVAMSGGIISAGTWQGAPITVPYGGTGNTSNTLYGVLYGNDTSALGTTAAPLPGQLLVGAASSAPSFVTLGGDATLAADGTLTLANSGVSAGSYGSTSIIPQILVDAKGRVTNIANIDISGTYESPLTFTNGLTRTTNDVHLGGTLSEVTTITQAAYDMIWNLSTIGDFRVQDNGTDFFYLSDSGRVGIGTTSPDYLVDIEGNLNTNTLYINGQEVLASGSELSILDGVTATATEINLLDGRTGTLLDDTNVSSYATTSVTAGSGMIGGGSAGAIVLDVNLGSDLAFDTDAVTLTTTGVSAGSYGTSSLIPQILVDSK
ncbi:MerR family DNA-binding transcriptional regulator, partial [Patescibacteria group bacterium]